MNSCDRWYYLENFYDSYSSDLVVPPVKLQSGLVSETTESSSVTEGGLAANRPTKSQAPRFYAESIPKDPVTLTEIGTSCLGENETFASRSHPITPGFSNRHRIPRPQSTRLPTKHHSNDSGVSVGSLSEVRSSFRSDVDILSRGLSSGSEKETHLSTTTTNINKRVGRLFLRKGEKEFPCQFQPRPISPSIPSTSSEGSTLKMIDDKRNNTGNHGHIQIYQHQRAFLANNHGSGSTMRIPSRKPSTSSTHSSSSSGHGSSTDNHNSDTEFDLDPLPERDERFWLSANDVSLTSLSSTKLQQHLSHGPVTKNGGGATRTNKFKDKKFRRKKSGLDDDIMTMTLSSNNSTTPLCLSRNGDDGDGYGDCPMNMTGAVITRKKSATNNAPNNSSGGTSGKSSSFATVRRRLSKPLITNSSINCNKVAKSARQNSDVVERVREGVTEENQSGSSCSVSSESSSSSVSLSKSKPRSLSLPEKVWNELLQINSSHNKAGRRNSLWTSSRRAVKSGERTSDGTGSSPVDNSEKRNKKYSSEINIFTAPKKPARRIFMMGDLAKNKSKDKDISSSPAGSSSGISSAALEIELEEVEEDAVKTNGDFNALTTTPNKSKLKRTKSGGNKWKVFIGKFQRTRNGSGSGGSDVSCDALKTSNGSSPNGKLRVSVRRRGSISANHKSGLKSRAMTTANFEPGCSEVNTGSESGITSPGTQTTTSTPESNKSRRLTAAPKLFKSFRLKKNKVAIGKEPETPLENQKASEQKPKQKAFSKLKSKAYIGESEVEDLEKENVDEVQTTVEKIPKIKTPGILRRKQKATKDKDKSPSRPITSTGNKLRSSKHLLSTFYIGTKERFSLNDFDDVTLDLASGELVNTADGTVIVQTDIVARKKVNSGNSSDKSNNKAVLRVSAGLPDEDEEDENEKPIRDIHIEISSPKRKYGGDRKKIKNPNSVDDVDSSPLSVAGQSSSSTPTASCSSSGAVGIPGSSKGRSRTFNATSEVTSGESPKKFLDRVKRGFSMSSGSGNRERDSSVGSSGNRRRKPSRNNPVSDGNGVDCSLHHTNTQQRHHQNTSSDDVEGSGHLYGKSADGIDDVFSGTVVEVSMKLSSEEELSIHSGDTHTIASNDDEGEGYNGPFDGKAVALVDCTPSPYDRHALRFKKGDIIDIISKKATGLWTGKLNNQVGHFKFINVRVLPTDVEDLDDATYADTMNYNCSIHCSHSPNEYKGHSGTHHSHFQYTHYRHNSEMGESPDQNNLNRSCYQHQRHRNKRLTPLSPWELEQRQTMANVINGFCKESSGGEAASGATVDEDGVTKERRSSALNQSGNNGAEAESESQQKGRKDKTERKKSSLKKGRPKSVGDLLQRINLEEHISVFYLHGFETLDLFKELKEEDLDELAITNSADRRIILTVVELLQEGTDEDETADSDYKTQTHSGGEHSQPRRIMAPSNFSRYPRDSGIFVGKCDADMDGDDGCESLHHEPSSLQSEIARDLEPAAETEEIILSPINLQKATTAAYSYANVSSRASSENIAILESKTKKGNGKILSRNTIMANAEQEYNDIWPVNENNSISRQMTKGIGASPFSNSCNSFDGNAGAAENAVSGSSNLSGNSQDQDSSAEAEVDGRQKFLQARSMFEKVPPSPGTSNSSTSPSISKMKDDDKDRGGLRTSQFLENRFHFSEKSGDSGISVSNNSPPKG